MLFQMSPTSKFSQARKQSKKRGDVVGCRGCLLSPHRRTNAHNALVEASLVHPPFLPSDLHDPKKASKPRMRSTAHFIREKNAFRPQPKQSVLTGFILKKKQVDKESIALWPFSTKYLVPSYRFYQGTLRHLIVLVVQ